MLAPYVYAALAHERHHAFLAQAEAGRQARQARLHRRQAGTSSPPAGETCQGHRAMTRPAQDRDPRGGFRRLRRSRMAGRHPARSPQTRLARHISWSAGTRPKTAAS